MAQSTVLPPAYWWIGPDTLNFEEKKQKDEKFDEWYDGEEFKIWEENNTWTPVWKKWQWQHSGNSSSGNSSSGRTNLHPSIYCIGVMNMTKVLMDITPFLEKQGYSISVRIKTRSDFKYTIAMAINNL